MTQLQLQVKEYSLMMTENNKTENYSHVKGISTDQKADKRKYQDDFDILGLVQKD